MLMILFFLKDIFSLLHFLNHVWFIALFFCFSLISPILYVFHQQKKLILLYCYIVDFALKIFRLINMQFGIVNFAVFFLFFFFLFLVSKILFVILIFKFFVTFNLDMSLFIHGFINIIEGKKLQAVCLERLPEIDFYKNGNCNQQKEIVDSNKEVSKNFFNNSTFLVIATLTTILLLTCATVFFFPLTTGGTVPSSSIRSSTFSAQFPSNSFPTQFPSNSFPTHFPSQLRALHFSCSSKNTASILNYKNLSNSSFFGGLFSSFMSFFWNGKIDSNASRSAFINDRDFQLYMYENISILEKLILESKKSSTQIELEQTLDSVGDELLQQLQPNDNKLQDVQESISQKDTSDEIKKKNDQLFSFVNDLKDNSTNKSKHSTLSQFQPTRNQQLVLFKQILDKRNSVCFSQNDCFLELKRQSKIIHSYLYNLRCQNLRSYNIEQLQSIRTMAIFDILSSQERFVFDLNEMYIGCISIFQDYRAGSGDLSDMMLDIFENNSLMERFVDFFLKINANDSPLQQRVEMLELFSSNVIGELHISDRKVFFKLLCFMYLGCFFNDKCLASEGDISTGLFEIFKIFFSSEGDYVHLNILGDHSISNIHYYLTHRIVDDNEKQTEEKLLTGVELKRRSFAFFVFFINHELQQLNLESFEIESGCFLKNAFLKTLFTIIVENLVLFSSEKTEG